MPDLQKTIEEKIIKNTEISEVIVKSTAWTSDPISLETLYGVQGYFSLQFILTGDGTATVEYLISADNVNYIKPSSASEIVTGFTKISNSI